MTDNFIALEQRFNALLKNISPQQRKTLAQQIGRQLAQSQRQRIKSQKNPDGSAFEPRRARKVRSKKGRIKTQAMFKKLGTARFMRTKNSAEQVNIGYLGGNAAIANVHQYGLKSLVRRDRDYQVQYAQRELLGFSDNDVKLVEELILAALANQMTKIK